MYFRQLLPSEVMPMIGRSVCGFTLAFAAPTTAPQAWLSTDLQMLLSP